MDTTKETRYLALIRGINVGGKNLIRMADLKACFENMGFMEVSTYIQSGNVLFKSHETDKKKLTVKIEKALAGAFENPLKVLVINKQELEAIIQNAPEGFGMKPDKYKYDALFLMPPFASKEVIGQIKLREGVDQAFPGNGVVYFSRVSELLSRSFLSKIVASPLYQSMTIRNWATTTRLHELMKQ